MYLSICLSIYLYVCFSIWLSLWNFLPIWKLNLKNKHFLRDFLQIWQLQAVAGKLGPHSSTTICIFHLHVFAPEMNSTKYDVSNTEIAPLPQNWCLEPPTSWPKMQKCCACHETCNTSNCLQIHHACPSFAHGRQTHKFSSLLTKYTIPCACLQKRRLNVRKCSETVSSLHFRLRNRKNTSHFWRFLEVERPKVPREWQFLALFTSYWHFSEVQLSKVLRTWQILTLYTSKSFKYRAFRH